MVKLRTLCSTDSHLPGLTMTSLKKVTANKASMTKKTKRSWRIHSTKQKEKIKPTNILDFVKTWRMLWSNVWCLRYAFHRSTMQKRGTSKANLKESFAERLFFELLQPSTSGVIRLNANDYGIHTEHDLSHRAHQVESASRWDQHRGESFHTPSLSIGLHHDQIPGFALCCFFQQWLLAVTNRDNRPYLTSKNLRPLPNQLLRGIILAPGKNLCISGTPMMRLNQALLATCSRFLCRGVQVESGRRGFGGYG